jgi:TRAP-type C4-dicarboxylate transport system substrate-binding protein
MKNIYKLFLMFTGILFAFGVSAQEHVIRIGGGHPTAVTYVNQFDTYFVPEVIKQAEAKGIKVRFVKAWGGTIAKLDNTSEAVEKGVLDIGLALPTFEASRLGLINFSNHVPFGTTNYGTIGKIGVRMVNELPILKESLRKDINVELLALIPGENYGMNLTKEISSFEQLKGKKIGASYTTAIWAAGAGSVTIGMGVGEIYQALQTNLVEGSVIYESFITGFKLDEVAKFWYQTEFGITLGVAPLMNLNTRRKLPAELVTIIDQVMEQTVYKVAEASNKRESDVRQQLQGRVKVIQITPSDKRKWAESLKDAPAKAAKELDARGLPGSTVFKTYLKFLKEGGHNLPFDYQI